MGSSGTRLVSEVGSYSKAVDVVMELGRILWDRAFVAECAPSHGRRYRVLEEGQLLAKASSDLKPVIGSLLHQLRDKGLLRSNGSGTGYFELSVFQPVTLVRLFLDGVKPDHELRYFAMRSIRRHYACLQSAGTAYLFNLLADAVDSARQSGAEETQRTYSIEVKNPSALLNRLRSDDEPFPTFLRAKLGSRLQDRIDSYDPSTVPPESLKNELVGEFDRLIRTEDFYVPEHLRNLRMTGRFEQIARGKRAGENLMNLNVHILTSAFPNEVAKVDARKRRARNNVRQPRPTMDYSAVLQPHLVGLLDRDVKFDGEPRKAVDLFIECCRAVDYIRAYSSVGSIRLQTAVVDSQFLLSNLFGIPTGIRGFDDLFGGGGIMLAEDLRKPGSNGLRGRSILIWGRFGTGKSSLSLHLAVEVARKGGLAWVMQLEQPAEESLYTLESMRALPNDGSMDIVIGYPEAKRLLEQKDQSKGDRGALIILTAARDSFEDFRNEFERSARLMKNYPLRLLCVDPVNSILRTKRPNIAALRAETLEMIKDVENTGTNVVLIAEEASDKENELLFEQNIADTVLHLSVEPRHGYATRYLEVQKSRLQREQRGRHPFSIATGKGLRVYLSSSALSNKIRPRSIRSPDTRIKFGLKSLDEILGPSGLAAGDVIAFRGSSGSLKTALALHFLLGSDWDFGTETSSSSPKHRRNYSLLLAARDDESTIRHMLGQEFLRGKSASIPPKSPDDIIVRSLPKGNVNPSFILQRIEDEFLTVRLRGDSIDRVVVDNIAHWEMSCPYVRDDHIFADTLIDFLRRQRVSSLLICGDPPANIPSAVQRPIIDNADCVIRFDKVEFRGTQRVMIRILKTRGMRHRLEAFEVSLTREALAVRPGSSLLRITRGGRVRPIRTRLFLHSETSMQEKYNDDLLVSLRSVLSRNTEIESQDHIYMERAMRLASASAVDELQVLQLDEFQLPRLRSGGERNPTLHTFAAFQWDEGWKDLVPRLHSKVTTAGKGFFAVPFFENISLLAYCEGQVDPEALGSWRGLAAASANWKASKGSAEASVFFDFPRKTGENYNCLFFEILLSLGDFPIGPSLCWLQEWLNQPSTIEACKIYRQLCRPAYIADHEHDSERQIKATVSSPIKVNPRAVVWRHWYTTLNEMLAELEPAVRENVRIRPLPSRQVSSAEVQHLTIAGEWYLAVPAHSAAPDVGLEIIKLMTTHEAELDRLRMGVGMPARSSFYEANPKSAPVPIDISPYFAMQSDQLGALVNSAFRRSYFDCYSQFSSVLAHHLRKVIEISDTSEPAIEARIRSIFESLAMTMGFISSSRDCKGCEVKSQAFTPLGSDLV